MIWPIYSFFVFLMSIWHPQEASAMSKKTHALPFKNEAIGVQTFKYEDETRNRPVLVELWYPTDEGVASHQVEEDVWVHPKEARDVALSSKISSYPLILMSHGMRGERRERTWLADALARQGYLVASVEHYGDTWRKYDPLMSFKFWERAKDISFSLSRLLENPNLKSRIDTNRIGFVGYSMGGMTGLALAGAQAKYAQAIAKVQYEQTKEISLEEFNGLDFSEAEKNYQEPRIHSILLICPATFAYLPEALKSVKTPIGMIASLDDEILPHADHAAKIMEHAPPRKTKLMKNKTSHYAFLNKMTKKGCEVLQKGVKDPIDWQPVHQETTDFTIQYFEDTLPAKKAQNK